MKHRKYELQCVEKVMEMIKKDLGSHYSIHQLKKIAGLNDFTLKKIFRDAHKISINKFRNQQRMEVAKHELLNTRKSIIEIADDLGYGNDRYFSNCFKKYTGRSPSIYREQNTI